MSKPNKNTLRKRDHESLMEIDSSHDHTLYSALVWNGLQRMGAFPEREAASLPVSGRTFLLKQEIPERKEDHREV